MEDTILNIAYTSDLDVTVLNVTHNISQAAYISNKVIVLRPWPCRVWEVIDIDYGVKKRTKEIRNSEKYRNYITIIEDTLARIS
jgi:NitT/TauT family transport system ATP-binding protein